MQGRVLYRALADIGRAFNEFVAKIKRALTSPLAKDRASGEVTDTKIGQTAWIGPTFSL